MEKYDEALKDYEKVFELDSTNLTALNDRAIIYDKLGKTELAIKEMEKLIKIEEDPLYYPLYYSNIALYYSNIDKFDNALENYTKAIELEIENKDKYYALRAHFVHEKTGNYELAIEDYSQAIFYNPDNSDYYTSRANLFREMEKYDEALEDFGKALELDSTITASINDEH